MNVPPIVPHKTNNPLEKVSEERLRKAVKKIGGESWKFVSPSNRGVSDRIVLFKGRVVFVEMKRMRKDLTPKQQKFRAKIINNCGEFATVCGNEGVDLFVQELLAGASWYRKLLLHFRSSNKMISGKYGK